MAEPDSTARCNIALSYAMAGDYQPISCIDHERLEFAALKQQWLDVDIVFGGCAGQHRLLPLDVYARDGAEWLEAQDEAGNKLKIRLDWVRF